MTVQRYVNEANIPLSVAVFLAKDNYDHEDNTISATGLIKPTRQTILASRLPEELNVVDISRLGKSRMGSAIHDGIERAWLDNPHETLLKLGYPQGMVEKIVVNPLPGELKDDQIPVYLEQRAYKEVDDVVVSGKFDFVAEGRVEDFKTTSVNTYMMNRKTEDYKLQGSIYRWLNPEIIYQDHMVIQFFFTDWMPGRAKADPNYPKNQVTSLNIPLLTVEDTDRFVRAKLSELKRYENTPEKDLPLCSDMDLWRSEPTWKYYKNPEKTARSTKNFTDRQAAYQRLAEDGGVGVIKEDPGQVVACKFCAAFPLCTQKDQYLADGSLKL